MKGNRKKMKTLQQNSTPVFLDVTHQSGEKTRFFGIIPNMSEDFPTGKQFPKYGIEFSFSEGLLDIRSSILLKFSLSISFSLFASSICIFLVYIPRFEP